MGSAVKEEVKKMKSLKSAVREELQKVKNQYDRFIEFTLDDADYYKNENPQILTQLMAYLTRHDNLTAGDVTEYMCYLIGLPYEAEDGKWYRWDTEITEEEAQKIVDEKYSE